MASLSPFSATAAYTPPPPPRSTNSPCIYSNSNPNDNILSRTMEPSRYIYVSGIPTACPLTELRYWFVRGHYIYDELRAPVIPAAVVGAGSNRLATDSSEAHPTWEETIPNYSSGAVVEVHDGGIWDSQGTDGWLEAQMQDIERAEAVLMLYEGEREAAVQEEKRLVEKKKRKAAIKSMTWTGSRGKYGNARGTARPYGFLGRRGPRGPHGGGHIGGVGGRTGGRYGGAAGAGSFQQGQRAPSPLPWEPAQGGGWSADAYPYAGGQVEHEHPNIQHFHPFPTPIAPLHEQTDMAGPASFDTFLDHQDFYYNESVPTEPQPYFEFDSRPTKPSWTWNHQAIPAATPAVSILSPRAVEFVPAGLFIPETGREFDIPMGIIDAYQSSEMLERVSMYSHPSMAGGGPYPWYQRKACHARKKSNLNPAASEFRPRAIPDEGPTMNYGYAGN